MLNTSKSVIFVGLTQCQQLKALQTVATSQPTWGENTYKHKPLKQTNQLWHETEKAEKDRERSLNLTMRTSLLNMNSEQDSGSKTGAQRQSLWSPVAWPDTGAQQRAPCTLPTPDSSYSLTAYDYWEDQRASLRVCVRMHVCIQRKTSIKSVRVWLLTEDFKRSGSDGLFESAEECRFVGKVTQFISHPTSVTAFRRLISPLLHTHPSPWLNCKL